MEKIKKILISLCLISIIAFSVCLITGKLFFATNKPVFIFNRAILIVVSPSMMPEFQVNSIITIKKTTFSDLQVGDVIAFKSNALNGGTALHRIVEITDEGIITKGDANEYADNEILKMPAIYGKCVRHTNALAPFLTILQTPKGIIFMIILPICAIFLLISGIKLIRKNRLQT